jgi:multidrug resistance efflux pump
LIKANEILLKIDPSDYQLAITQAETEIEAAKVQLAQIDIQESNARASLAIERQALKIAEET